MIVLVVGSHHVIGHKCDHACFSRVCGLGYDRWRAIKCICDFYHGCVRSGGRAMDCGCLVMLWLQAGYCITFWPVHKMGL